MFKETVHGDMMLLLKDNVNKYIMIVNEREFHIWKLELWWVCFNSAQFYPEGRIHLIGNWFWRI